MGSATIEKIELVIHKPKYQDFIHHKNQLVTRGFPALTLALFHGSNKPAEYIINN